MWLFWGYGGSDGNKVNRERGELLWILSFSLFWSPFVFWIALSLWVAGVEKMILEVIELG